MLSATKNSIEKVAIVNFGLGNLFSIKHACIQFGLQAFITNSKEEILSAGAVILPGVGAFGDAVDSLKRLDLLPVLRDVALSEKPLIGICLGMQLLMDESFEFGHHRGLGLISGSVVRLKKPADGKGNILKVPHVGWNRIFRERNDESANWETSPLKGIKNGDSMYFVHSFYVIPENPSVILSKTHYGNISFCSSLLHRNIFACQFHPERSASSGLKIYQNIKNMMTKNVNEEKNG